MAKRILNPIAAYEAEMQMASRPPGATQAEQAASVRALLYAHFRKSNSFGSLQHMAGVIEQITPDLKHAPGACNPGLKAFYNFDAPLSNANASQVAVEIKVRTVPSINLLPSLQSDLTAVCSRFSTGSPPQHARYRRLPHPGGSRDSLPGPVEWRVYLQAR